METGKKDRISKYLIRHNENMLFGELREEFLRSMGAQGILSGIPVPISEGENGQIAVRDIVLDMAKVTGADPDFVYADKYIAYIKAAAGDQAEPMLVSEGARLADEGRYEEACMLLRTALAIEPESRAALYLYARACKACYETVSAEEAESGQTKEGEEYIGSFKAESTDLFEVLTMLHPEFAMGYYFLGYAYLNLGLYIKARLTWDDFMKYSSAADAGDAGMDADQIEDLRHEISGRLLDLEEPVQIEKGCNQIMGGDFAGGRDTLLAFREGRYSGWWPLWYYLAVAEVSLGNAEAAIEDYRRVLAITPGNADVMDELSAVYEATGDTDNAAKYKTKAELVRRNYAESQMEQGIN